VGVANTRRSLDQPLNAAAIVRFADPSTASLGEIAYPAI
jgi:hypothetical protein